MLQWGLLILKNQNPTLSLVYGVFSITGTLEAFLLFDLRSAFVNIFWLVLQLWVICQSVSERSDSRCTVSGVWFELAAFLTFRLHECTEIMFLEHSAAASGLREISRDTGSGNLIIEEVRSWEIKVQISIWGFGCWVMFWFYSCGVSLVWNCLSWELLDIIYHYFLSNTGMCQLS